MNYIRTFSGVDIYLCGQDINRITIEDIACHLSRVNRYVGASQIIINVAWHSINVARHLAEQREPAVVQLQGLLHDGHEYVLGDISSPVKREIRRRCKSDVLGQMAAEIDRRIFERFDLLRFVTAKTSHAVHCADRRVLAAEWRDWMHGPCPDASEPAKFAIKPCSPDKAETKFLETFRQLQMQAGLSTQYRNAPSGIFK